MKALVTSSNHSHSTRSSKLMQWLPLSRGTMRCYSDGVTMTTRKMKYGLMKRRLGNRKILSFFFFFWISVVFIQNVCIWEKKVKVNGNLLQNEQFSLVLLINSVYSNCWISLAHALDSLFVRKISVLKVPLILCCQRVEI